MYSYPEAVNAIAANASTQVESGRTLTKIIVATFVIFPIIFIQKFSDMPWVSVGLPLVFWSLAVGIWRLDRRVKHNVERGLEALKNPMERIVWAYPDITYIGGKGVKTGLMLGLDNGRLVGLNGTERHIEAALAALESFGITTGFTKARKRAFRESPKLLVETAPKPRSAGLEPTSAAPEAAEAALAASTSTVATPPQADIGDLAKAIGASAEASHKRLVWILGVVVAFVAWHFLKGLVYGVGSPVFIAFRAGVAASVIGLYVWLVRRQKRNFTAGLHALAKPSERIVWAYPEVTTWQGVLDVGGVNLGLPDGRLVKLYAKPRLAEKTLASLEQQGITVGYSDARKKAFRKAPRSLAAAA